MVFDNKKYYQDNKEKIKQNSKDWYELRYLESQKISKNRKKRFLSYYEQFLSKNNIFQ